MSRIICTKYTIHDTHDTWHLDLVENGTINFLDVFDCYECCCWMPNTIPSKISYPILRSLLIFHFLNKNNELIRVNLCSLARLAALHFPYSQLIWYSYENLKKDFNRIILLNSGALCSKIEFSTFLRTIFFIRWIQYKRWAKEREMVFSVQMLFASMHSNIRLELGFVCIANLGKRYISKIMRKSLRLFFKGYISVKYNKKKKIIKKMENWPCFKGHLVFLFAYFFWLCANVDKKLMG